MAERGFGVGKEGGRPEGARLRGGLGWERRVAGRRAPRLRGGLGWEGRVAGRRAPRLRGGVGMGREGGRPEGTSERAGFKVGVKQNLLCVYILCGFLGV